MKRENLNAPVVAETYVNKQIELETAELAEYSRAADASRARIAALMEKSRAPSAYEDLPATSNRAEAEEIHVDVMGEDEEAIKRITSSNEVDGHHPEQGGKDREEWRPTEKALRGQTGRERQNRRCSERLLARVEGFCEAAEKQAGGPASGGADLGRFIATCGEGELEHHRQSLVDAHASIGRAISLIVAIKAFRFPAVPAADPATA